MRSTFFGKRLLGAAFFTAVLACWTLLGMATSQEPLGKSTAEASVAAAQKAKETPKQITRHAPRRKRAPAPNVQTDMKMVRKSQSEFQDPEEIHNPQIVNLRLTTGTFPNANSQVDDSPDNFQLLCYDVDEKKGKAVGPTIYVERGATFEIKLDNKLSVVNRFPTGPVVEKFVPPNSKALKPMDLCSTNLHTHGLHVSPGDPADNIYRSIPPGGSHTFRYTIPLNHPAGTFWYHPHLHGSVAYQLSNGLAGALIVKGGPKAKDFKDLEDIPEIKKIKKDRVLVLQLYNYTVDSNKTARIDASTIYNVTPDLFNCPTLSPEDYSQLNLGTGSSQAIAIFASATIKVTGMYIAPDMQSKIKNIQVTLIGPQHGCATKCADL
jgi:FtsP/CotA-like multicopper oxidase with cupredoxin domain